MRRVGVAGVGDVLAGRAELHRQRGFTDHGPGDRGDDPDAEDAVALRVAMTLTKPSGSRLVLARLLASIGNLPTWTSPSFFASSSVRPTPAISGIVCRHQGITLWFTMPVSPAMFSATAMPSSSALWAALGRDHVADRPDARHLGAEFVVGLDLAALVGLQARLVEREAFGVGLAPDRDEDDVGFDGLGSAARGRLDCQGDGIALALSLGDLGREAELEPCFLKILFASSPRRRRSRENLVEELDDVTCAPRRRQTEPSSSPMTPPPMTTMRFGTSDNSNAPVESTIRS